MKKIITMAVLIFSSMLTYACTGGAEQKQAETQKTAQDGSVIVMNKAMFIKDIFDYEKSKEWKYKGDKPAIIDLYADWCGPCRMTAPIMKELAKEYAGKKEGMSVFDPVFVLSAILDWAGIVCNERGYLELTADYRTRAEGR